MSALIPENIEASEISSTLNSLILFIFLMGMYTVIYFGSIYVYFTMNPSKYNPVAVAITMLYLTSIAMTACQWYITKWEFVNNGDTREAVFFAIIGSPRWAFIAFTTSNCVAFVIADGLLIWRCFHVWNRSLRIISVPLFLIVVELALFLVEISFDARYSNSDVSPALAAKFDAVLSSAFFMSFSSTFVTTVLIAYRIYAVSKFEGASSRRFKHIIDIVVQSGAVSALSQLIAALAGVVPGGNSLNSTREFAFQNYTQLVNFAITGISSMVMVARVALLSADTTYPSTSVHLSGLQFHAHSTHPTANLDGMQIAHSVDTDRMSTGRGQAVEGKVQ